MFESCPLSGIEKHPLLGGYLCISTIVISIRNTAFVRCREVVRFSEGPLLEVRLYIVMYPTYVWQSRVEIEGYSVAYFDRIAAFKAPYR